MISQSRVRLNDIVSHPIFNFVLIGFTRCIIKYIKYHLRDASQAENLFNLYCFVPIIIVIIIIIVFFWFVKTEYLLIYIFIHFILWVSWFLRLCLMLTIRIFSEEPVKGCFFLFVGVCKVVNFSMYCLKFSVCVNSFIFLWMNMVWIVRIYLWHVHLCFEKLYRILKFLGIAARFND